MNALTVKLGIGITSAAISVCGAYVLLLGCRAPATPTTNADGSTQASDATIVEAIPTPADADTTSTAKRFCAALSMAKCAEGTDPNCVAVVAHAIEARLSPSISPSVARCLDAVPYVPTAQDVHRCGTDCTP